MTQRQLPGGGFLTGGSGRQSQLPGGGFLSEPAVPVDIAVPSASLTLTAHAPTVDVTDGVPISVPSASLTLTAHAPVVSVTAPQDIVVPRGTLTLTAYPPFVRVASSATSTTTSASRRPGLLLTDDLPLQLSTQIGAFAAAQPLPQRYGDLRKSRFKLIRMTSTKFIAAGHPMKSITRAFTDDLQTKSFKHYVESAGGVTYHVVEFAAPVPLGSECTASGEGKMHPVTGALIENPADMMADLLLLAGRTDPWFGQLRTEAYAAGIKLAGSFTTIESIRSALDRVADSAGAMWCPGMARLYPSAFEGFKIDLDAFNAHDLAVSASVTDTGDIARVSFDYDDAEGRNQSFIQLEASPQRYGGRLVDLELPLVRSVSVAESIGRRALGWYAGERYDVSARVDLGEVPQGAEFVRPGTWALLTGHPQWAYAENPYVMIPRIVIRRRENFAEISGEVLRTTPTITLTKHSLGSNSIGSGGVEVDVRDGITTLTIRDPDDKPLSGAYVSLDGEAPKKTNEQGQVTYITTEGEHELAISAVGMVDVFMQITL